jgi:hypothetical protein
MKNTSTIPRLSIADEPLKIEPLEKKHVASQKGGKRKYANVHKALLNENLLNT